MIASGFDKPMDTERLMMTWGAAGELTGLFVAALLSATLLPGASEAAFALVLAKGTSSPTAAIAIATVGNTLGSTVNWAIGRFLSSYKHHPRFPVRSDRYADYVAAYQRWGVWTLLLSWVPIIGDPLTVISGALRTPLSLFIGLVTIAKLGRYLAVAGLVSWF